MKTLLLSCTLIICLSSAFGADSPVDLSLTDGSRIRGKVMSSNGSEVTVMSDIGVLRIAIEKLTPESRQSWQT
jgi:hypothetical protein